MPAGNRNREVWARLTPEERTARVAKTQSDEARAKRIATLRTPEMKQRLAEANSKTWQSFGYRAKRAKTKLDLTDAHREQSRRNLAKAMTAEAREKARQKQRAFGVKRAAVQQQILRDLEKSHGLTRACRDVALINEVLDHHGVYVNVLTAYLQMPSTTMWRYRKRHKEK